MNNISTMRVGAVYRKELREYRRNRSLVVGMAILPLVFAINPLVEIFAIPASSASGLRHGDILLYMLGIPALVPAFVAAYSVAGERQQGTLEPVLITPIRREEFVLGKALAALAPALAIAYAVYAVVVACVIFFAAPGVAAALLQGPQLLAQLLFTPLLAGWSIWIGMTISTRTSDVRVAQQLGMLASLPSVAVTSLIALAVIPASLGLAVFFALVLLALNWLGWRMTSASFDRERLVTGAR